MNQDKKYKLMDLVDDIKKVDGMIKLHSSNPSGFMLEQYKEKKEKLMGYLVDELVDPEIRSEKSFSIIILLIHKFYPNLNSESQNDKYNEALNDLEAALAG